MRHTHYARLIIATHEVELLPFAPIDGERFNEKMRKGYSTETALSIVNRWNYITSHQLSKTWTKHVYFVPTVEGAA